MLGFLIVAALAPAPVATCRAGVSLEQIVTAADQRVREGSRRLAIKRCYAPFPDSEEFEGGALAFQERFLFEYLAAADAEAKARTAKTDVIFYYQHAKAAGAKYIAWYGSLADSERQALPKTHPPRPSRALFMLAGAQVRLADLAPDENARVAENLALLDTLESIADCTSLCRGDILDSWEERLRLYPVSFRALPPRSDAQVRDAIALDEGYGQRWITFRDTLLALKDVASLRVVARRQLQKLGPLGLPPSVALQDRSRNQERRAMAR